MTTEIFDTFLDAIADLSSVTGEFEEKLMIILGQATNLTPQAEGSALARLAANLMNKRQGAENGWVTYVKFGAKTCVCNGYGGTYWKEIWGPEFHELHTGGMDGQGTFDDMLDAYRAAAAKYRRYRNNW